MLSLYELKKILNPKQDSTPEDDFRIIQSWAEYDEKSSKPPEERNLKYLCYELEVMNPDTGEICKGDPSSGKCETVYCVHGYAGTDSCRCT